MLGLVVGAALALFAAAREREVERASETEEMLARERDRSEALDRRVSELEEPYSWTIGRG